MNRKNSVIIFILLGLVAIGLYFCLLRKTKFDSEKSGSENSHSKNANCSIELHENNQIVYSDTLLKLPPETKTKLVINVKSFLKKRLENITIMSSCSCSDVSFDNKTLDIGQAGQITVIFNSSGKRGKELIKLFLKSGDSHLYPIQLGVQIVENQSDMYLSFLPREIYFNETSDSLRDKTFKINISCKETVSDLSIKPSATYMNTSLDSNVLESNGDSLVVSFTNPPTGIIKDSISIFYSIGNTDYESIIPVHGNIKMPFNASSFHVAIFASPFIISS